MTQPFGIDTSVLVRLTTREPEKDFEHCVEELRALIEGQGNEIFASNQVIGEAYIAIQHHYGISDLDTRASLINLLTSGLVSPLNGHSAIITLQTTANPSLFDRLIADEYSRAGLETLTLGQRMASLPRVRRL